MTDALGLYLLVNPHGSKLWRLAPELNLAEARAARKQLVHSVRPPDRALLHASKRCYDNAVPHQNMGPSSGIFSVTTPTP